jgi:hypothetical protein
VPTVLSQVHIACVDRIFRPSPIGVTQRIFVGFCSWCRRSTLLCPRNRQIAPNNTQSLGSQGALLPQCRCKLLWGGLVGFHLSSQTSAHPSVQKPCYSRPSMFQQFRQGGWAVPLSCEHPALLSWLSFINKVQQRFCAVLGQDICSTKPLLILQDCNNKWSPLTIFAVIAGVIALSALATVATCLRVTR